MRIYLAILQSAAFLVPGEQRAEWLAEWKAEVWYVRRSGESQTNGFCLGAFRDALWLRRNSPPVARPWLSLESPAHCLGMLGLLAVTCVLLAVRHQPPDCPLLPIGPPFFAMLLIALLALPTLMAITSCRLGDYPSQGSGWRWLFFASKIALVIPIVFLGCVMVLWPVVGGIIGTDCMLVLNVIAFRWAVIDQRLRCPECLRLLKHPSTIGQPSHTFLEWYGTEFVCGKGHGLLHVPETSMNSLPTQRWLHLDESWSLWFS